PRRLELFRALAERPSEESGRLEEPRVKALIRLQEALQAAQLGIRPEANEALRAAFGVDPSLRTDAGYLFWRLGPVQRRRLPDGARDREFHWVRLLADPRRTVETAISKGAAAGHTGAWAVDAARAEMSAEAQRALQWALVANELGLDGCRLSPRLLGACILRLIRRPRLLGERWFVKTL